MSAPRTARDRIREELTGEILAVARGHLAREGAAALSLRSIARDLEMAPSALYRYFAGRDALLSALILDAYGSLADMAEDAAAAAAGGRPDSEQWMAVPRAMRSWALGHPHEWGLIFGSPVPGYEAPEETVVPYARLAGALVQPINEAHRAGRLEDRPGASSPEMDVALAPVAEAILSGVPGLVVAAAMRAWVSLIGVISLEVFGHWRRTVLDPELFFEDVLAQAAIAIGLSAQPVP
jgi:AcrR family transcriptional regulator